MKTNGTLCQLPDLRGGATHQFRKAGVRNAPWSAAWEDSHDGWKSEGSNDLPTKETIS